MRRSSHGDAAQPEAKAQRKFCFLQSRECRAYVPSLCFCQRKRKGRLIARETDQPTPQSYPPDAVMGLGWSCPGFVDGYGFGRAGGSWLRS